MSFWGCTLCGRGEPHAPDCPITRSSALTPEQEALSEDAMRDPRVPWRTCGADCPCRLPDG